MEWWRISGGIRLFAIQKSEGLLQAIKSDPPTAFSRSYLIDLKAWTVLVIRVDGPSKIEARQLPDSWRSSRRHFARYGVAEIYFVGALVCALFVLMWCHLSNCLGDDYDARRDGETMVQDKHPPSQSTPARIVSCGCLRIRRSGGDKVRSNG